MRDKISRYLEYGFGLTTAEILYRRPDHLWLLQTYVWQDYDVYPDFPELNRFLEFWTETLDGPLHSVRISHNHMMLPTELNIINGVYSI
jgi:uncharacterized protein Usg